MSGKRMKRYEFNQGGDAIDRKKVGPNFSVPSWDIYIIMEGENDYEE
jgi:hypothetical protein